MVFRRGCGSGIRRKIDTRVAEILPVRVASVAPRIGVFELLQLEPIAQLLVVVVDEIPLDLSVDGGHHRQYYIRSVHIFIVL